MIAAMSAVLWITAPAQATDQVVPEPAPILIATPRWLQSPQPQYPVVALQRDIEGWAAVRCKVEASGRLVACSAVEEMPVGAGFAEEAVKAMATATLVPVEGGHPDSEIRVRLQFDLP